MVKPDKPLKIGEVARLLGVSHFYGESVCETRSSSVLSYSWRAEGI